MAEATFNGVKFTDADVVNPDEYDSTGWRRLDVYQPFLLHDHGFVVCVVFAQTEQDALDEAADKGKLGRYLVKPEQFGEYGGEDKVYDRCAPLGNSGELHDIETLVIARIPSPPFSFAALFSNHREQEKS